MGDANFRFLRAALLGAVLLLPGALPALAGDPVVARTLLESGRRAVNSRKYDEAVPLLQRALKEDPDLAEAHYWLGVVCDRQKDEPGALSAYRQFLRALDARNGEPTSEERRYRSQAERRVDALAAGEKEFRKLEDRYVEDLLSFAKRKSSRDPGIALEALDLLLAVRPGHGDALSLWKELGGRAREGPGEGAPDPKDFVAVREWRDLLAGKEITSRVISYDGDLMIVDTRGGTKVTPRRPPDLGPLFAYETEFRVAEAYEPGWLVGLTFAEKGEVFHAAFVNRARVVLFEGTGVDGKRDLATHEMTPLEPGAWHRLGIVVRGQEVEIWLDGKMVMRERILEREDLSGDVGIWQQGCRTERRVFRAGKL